MTVEHSSLKGVYTLFKPQQAALPILFDSPHSGTILPDDFNYVCSPEDLHRLSDLYIDELFSDVTQYGYQLLQAETSRTYIDLNRAHNDIDLELINGLWSYPISTKGRSKHGVGLIFRQGYNGTNIYKDKLSPETVKQRIDHVYTPYHDCLTKELNALYQKYGQVLHINCHSFPSKQGIQKLPDFVLGDRCGTTCPPQITQRLKQAIETYGYSVAINHPYQGSTLIRKTGVPLENRYSIQIEINRKLYMNEQKLIKNIKFNNLKEKINLIIKDMNELLFRNDLAAD